MICIPRAAAASLLALAAACSDAREIAEPPTVDEQTALAEARAMIPADEVAAEPKPEETPTP